MSSSARTTVTAYIGLGANLGEPLLALSLAIERLGQITGVRVACCSAFYRSTPIDSSGPDYVNAVLELNTWLCAPALLSAMQTIEQQAGRQRPYPNAPRTLDLDLLLYGSGCIASSHLVVPHARMKQRAFVLLPLAEIAPHLVSPAELEAVAAQSIVRL